MTPVETGADFLAMMRFPAESLGSNVGPVLGLISCLTRMIDDLNYYKLIFYKQHLKKNTRKKKVK